MVPLGIDGRVVLDGATEVELVSGSAVLVRVPTGKGVAGTLGCDARFLGWLAALHELGCVVGGILAVLVKDEPVTFGGIDREHHIAGQRERRTVWIAGTRRIVRDVRTSGAHVPAFEVLRGACRRVRHVDGIREGVLIAVEVGRRGAKRHVVLVEVRDADGLEDDGIQI